MIIKSMSRKEPSFGQLMDYIDRDGGEERYRIRHNLVARDRARIRGEFEHNATHMRSRKNGVFLYHEIISLTRAEGIPLEVQKERLHQIAQEYIAARAPQNLCYGGLHDDKDHSLHYHLLISANRAGEAKRHRLSKEQFRTIQISLERYVLESFPELEQRIAIDKRADDRVKLPEAELRRRGGKATQREEVAARVRDALGASQGREGLHRALQHSGLEFYVRGNTLGVIDGATGKRHRLHTLDPELVPAIEARMAEVTQEAEREQPRQKTAGEKKRGPADEKEKQGQTVRPEPQSAPSEPKLSETQERWKRQAEAERHEERQRERGRGDDEERQR